MNIVYICADLGIPVLGHKGASVHVREFTAALAELGHQVHIIGASGSDATTLKGHADVARVDTTLGLTDTGEGSISLTVLPPSREIRDHAASIANIIQRLGMPRNPAHTQSEMRHALADPEFAEHATAVAREFAPDLVIARHALFSLAGQDVARAMGIPCVLEVNAPLIEERRNYWGLTFDTLAEHAERTAFQRADRLIAISEGVRSYMLRHDAAEERIVTLPNGVNLHRFHPEVNGERVRREYNLGQRLLVGFAGSLKPWHGVDQLLRAFAAMYPGPSVKRSGADAQQDAGEDPCLLIMGEGPQRESLEALARSLDLGDRALFTGAISHERMPEYLAALDIAVAPYQSSDGFYFSPLKVIEYMAMGLPVIAPLLGQIPYLLDDRREPCGLLYHADDQRDLTRALRSLIGDAQLRRTLGAAGARRAADRHAWTAVAQRAIEGYDRAPTGTLAQHIGAD